MAKSTKKKVELNLWFLEENYMILAIVNQTLRFYIKNEIDIPHKLLHLYFEILNNDKEIDLSEFYNIAYSKISDKRKIEELKIDNTAREIFEHLTKYANTRKRNPIKLQNFYDFIVRIVEKLKLFEKSPDDGLNIEEKRSQIFKNVFEIIRKEFTVKEFKQIKQGDFLGFDDVEEQLVKDRFIRIITCVIISKHYFYFNVDKTPEEAEDYVEMSRSYLESDDSKETKSEKRNLKILNNAAKIIGSLLNRPMKEATLVEKLCKAMECGQRKIEGILNDLIEKDIVIPNNKKASKLNFTLNDKEEAVYYLERN